MGGGATVMDWLAPSLHGANKIEENIWYYDAAFGVSEEVFYKDLNLIDPAQLAKQIKVSVPPLRDPKNGDFTVTYTGPGGPFGTDVSSWLNGPDWNGIAFEYEKDYLEYYAEFSAANDEMKSAVKFLEEAGPFDFYAAADLGNLREYLTELLHENGFENSSIPYILKTWGPRSGVDDYGDPVMSPGWISSPNPRDSSTDRNNRLGYDTDPFGIVNMMNPDVGNNNSRDKAGNLVNLKAQNNGNINAEALATSVEEAKADIEYKYLVMVITHYNDGHSYTQGDTHKNGLKMLAEYDDPTIPAVHVTGPETLMLSDKTATYTFSMKNMPQDISLITLSFRVEDAFFYGQSVNGLNGWTVVRDSGWAPDGDTHWIKEVMLVKAGGAPVGDYDFLKVVLEYRGAIGTTQVDIVGASAATPVGEVALKIGKPAVTVIDPYSRYDVNRDGTVDLADVAAAAFFYMRTREDSDWADFVDFDGVKVSPERCDVNGDGKVDVEDLVLIMNNYSKP
jgi:hypothetical protein